MAGKGTTETAVGQLNNTRECCMCGDLGFSDQLFQCKICQFRSQHRYCSNLYPKTEYFGTCNWCLIHHQKLDDTKDQKSPNSSNNSSSPSPKNNNNDIIVNDESNKNRRLKKGLIRGNSNSTSISIQPIKKIQKSSETRSSPKSSSPTPSPSPSPLPSPSPSTPRKRIVTNGALEERLRRTKSEDIVANGRNSSGAAANVTTRHVFRNKVRRYKLLDEVSS